MKIADVLARVRAMAPGDAHARTRLLRRWAGVLRANDPAASRAVARAAGRVTAR